MLVLPLPPLWKVVFRAAPDWDTVCRMSPIEVRPVAFNCVAVRIVTGCAVSTSVRLMRVPVTSILPNWAVFWLLVGAVVVVVLGPGAPPANAAGAATADTAPATRARRTALLIWLLFIRDS